MHPNPVFRNETHDRNLEFAAARGFGMLTINGESSPLIAHVPFALSQGRDMIEMHLVRSNPVARAVPAQAVMAVGGPDAYISPDWYGIDDQVPTWNYIAVHIRGRLELRPQEELRGMLDRLTARFEADLPKPPWTADKMPPELLDRMMRSIVPARLHIEDVQGTWKANQNKPDPVRLAAADQLEAANAGAETGVSLLTRMMRGITER